MIEIREISEVWPSIIPGLLSIKQKTAAVWEIDQVYERCDSGAWVLFTAPTGWMMVSFYRDEFTGQAILEVNCCYNRSDRGIDEYIPFLKELAEKTGVNAIVVRSPRKGWERKGFRPVDILYRMEVQHDVVS